MRAQLALVVLIPFAVFWNFPPLPSIRNDASGGASSRRTRSNPKLLLEGRFALGAKRLRDRVVDHRIDLRAQQYHRCSKVEVKEQTHCRSQAPVGGAVVCEGGQVEGETNRSDRP